MNRSLLFNRTRWRIAAYYAGVMGMLLSISGVVVYEVMVQIYWNGLHRELNLVAGTLHDGLEPKLQQAGKIKPIVKQYLPGLCIKGIQCPEDSQMTDRHLLGAVQQASYYVRLLNLSGEVVATLGYQPEGLQVKTDKMWQTLQDTGGHNYHQITLLLSNDVHDPWGYIQVGRSIRDFDDHLMTLKLVILFGLPLMLVTITAASWWLSGQAMHPVYQSYRHIQQFTADAAHELRTPLAAMRATLEFVLQLPRLSEEEARDTLQTLERQNNRLSQLVQDLLLLSRMDAQAQVLKAQPCCLNDIVADIVEEFAALAIASDIMLTANMQTSQLIYSLGDEEKLYRLLANLVTNAIQYTPKGGKVTVYLRQEELSAVLQVEDTGIGIPTDEQTQIFDRFYRITSDRSRSTGGAGLGLPIAQAIVELHQGRIAVESELGKGSRFTVYLPLMKAGLPESGNSSSGISSGMSGTPSGPTARHLSGNK